MVGGVYVAFAYTECGGFGDAEHPSATKHPIIGVADFQSVVFVFYLVVVAPGLRFARGELLGEVCEIEFIVLSPE